MSTYWLSVLIPVYNVSNYINDCVESIFKQDLEGVEVIFLDDKSTDDSLVKLKDKIGIHNINNVQILTHNENRGLSAARNSLLLASTGEYVWFVDSDDIFCDGAIEKIKHIAADSKPDLILIDYYKFYEEDYTFKKNKPTKKVVKTFDGCEGQLKTSPEYLFRGLFARQQMYTWARISKRSLWDDLKFPEGRYFEDISTTPILALKTESYFYLPDACIGYRQRMNSIVSSMDEKKLMHRLTALDGVLAQWLSKYPTLSLKSKYLFFRYGVKDYLRGSNTLIKNKLNKSTQKKYFNIAIKSMGSSSSEILKCSFLCGDLKLSIRLLKRMFF